MSDWYEDWQQPAHAERFDERAALDGRNLVRNYDAFNDVRLLRERLDPARACDLLEIGCATGEFSRYLRITLPRVRYVGLDVSAPAVAKARAKYPEGRFEVVDPSAVLDQTVQRLDLPRHPDVIYSKDVIQHQVKPFEFLSSLIGQAADTVIIRGRTRDTGATELDPELSCQYHYDGWMPYIVLNVEELAGHILRRAPGCEIVVRRHHMVLGGRHERFLPKALYLRETGTAETAVGIFKQTAHPGRVTIEDRPEPSAVCTWDYRVKRLLRRAVAGSARP